MENTNIKGKFAKYVVLNVLGMIGLSCYILADTFFVAQGIGADGLTALNLAIPVYSFIYGTGMMIGMGAATRFAISRAKDIFTQALYLVAVFAVLYITLGIFGVDVLAQMLGADAVTHQMTAVYLRVILCFSPMFMMNNVVLCFARNDQAPRLAMTAMLLGSLSNIILDYVFIFILDMGMFGAAFATGIAPVVGLSVLSLHFIRRKNTFKVRKAPVRLAALRDICGLGVYALVTEVATGVVIIIFNLLILGISGNTGVAAYGIIANIAYVVTAIYTGISQGVQPVISESYGRGNRNETDRIYRYGIVTALILSACIYGLLYFFAEPVASIFNRDGDATLAGIAVEGIRIYFLSVPFAGVNIITTAFFSSVDTPKPAFLVSVLRGIVVIIPTAVIMAEIWNMTGVWMAITVTEVLVLGVAMTALVKYGKNTKKAEKESSYTQI